MPQMTDSFADLLFVAGVSHDINRDGEAIDFLKRAIGLNPSLDRDSRATFITIYKTALDRLRKTISVLSDSLRFRRIQEGTSPAICEKIEVIRDRTIAELTSLCSETLELVNDALLPANDGYQSQVFFHKFRGDLCRYLSEVADTEKRDTGKELARSAYIRGLEIAENLPIADPVRLGTILNYGYFVHEHIGDAAAAIELVRDAAERANAALHELSEWGLKEATDVLGQMRRNLANWQDEEDTDFDEEEAEHK
jgi:hypothetical protein